MAASANRVYHQDYIARIRYSNVLPPPPNPPKLLDIPNTGLSSNQYTSAGFASRLAREQPLNIEADAELGMPINLVGLPGVFDGDESSIYSLETPPLPHPHDRALLRPLSTLGKPNAVTSGVSFLRRTEYISSDQARSRFESTTSKDLVRPRGETKKRKRPETATESDPTYILRSVVKGFDIAYPADAHTGADSSSHVKGAKIETLETDAWDNPKHPTNPNVFVLDTYPVLPDLDALPDAGDYMVVKFNTTPFTFSGSYDSRLDVGLLRPLQLSAEAQARLQDQIAAHEADSTLPEPVWADYEYQLFVPKEVDTARAFQQMWGRESAQSTDTATLQTAGDVSGGSEFRYYCVRAYETHQQTTHVENLYGDTVALVLHDDENSGTRNRSGSRVLPRGAYFYPISRRLFVRPRRNTKAPMVSGTSSAARLDDDERVDFLDVTIRDPDEAESAQRERHKASYFGDGEEL